MHIYERIKKAREKSGLTPEALAAKIGVARTTYLYWEESTPKPEKVMSVAVALGLPEYYFFIPGEDEKENKTDETIDEIPDTSNENAVSDESIVNEPPVEYLKTNTTPDYLAGRLAEKDATIAQIEKRIQDASAFAKKMEDHYQDMKEALERSQLAINDFLKPMAISLKDIPPVLDVIARNSHEHDKEIMKALDHLVGNLPGTLEKESGRRILKGALERQKKGKADVGKQD